MKNTMKTVCYEWDVEEMEGDEIVNHNHSDSIPSAAMKENEVLVLVRDQQRGCRSWAYVSDGKLSPVFKDAYDRVVCDVPKRFRDEFEKSIHASR